MICSVFIDIDEKIRLKRRIIRDTTSRGRNDRSVKEQFRTCVKPMHNKFVGPTKKYADIILSNDDVSFDKLYNIITKILNKSG